MKRWFGLYVWESSLIFGHLYVLKEQAKYIINSGLTRYIHSQIIWHRLYKS